MAEKSEKGFIALHRKIVEWEWYDDKNAFRLFLHILLTANWQNKKWRGTTIKRGQKLTSLPSLVQETGLTLQQVRTSLSKLSSTGEITDKATTKNRLITVIKYDDYQDKKQTKEQPSNRQVTDKEHLLNNENNYNKENNSPLIPQGGGVDVYVGDKFYSCASVLGASGIEAAKKNAPEWDVDNLFGIYKAGIDSGEREAPNNIKKAFPAWCLKYTGGKAP